LILIIIEFLYSLKSNEFNNISDFSIENFLITHIIFFKIQLLVKVFGLYAAVGNNRKLTKFISSGILMGGFAFVNFYLMFSNISDSYIIVYLKSTPFYKCIIYVNLSLILVQLLSFSLASNIDIVTKNLNLSLNRNLILALIICQLLLATVTIISIRLLYPLIVKLNDYLNGDSVIYRYQSKF